MQKNTDTHDAQVDFGRVHGWMERDGEGKASWRPGSDILISYRNKSRLCIRISSPVFFGSFATIINQ